MKTLVYGKTHPRAGQPVAKNDRLKSDFQGVMSHYEVDSWDTERKQVFVRYMGDDHFASPHSHTTTVFAAGILGMDWLDTEHVAPKFVVVEGNPVEGFKYYGPMATREEASAYAGRVFDDQLQWSWWIVPLETPT